MRPVGFRVPFLGKADAAFIIPEVFERRAPTKTDDLSAASPLAPQTSERPREGPFVSQS